MKPLLLFYNFGPAMKEIRSKELDRSKEREEYKKKRKVEGGKRAYDTWLLRIEKQLKKK